jgi:hypothetical protein
MVEKVHSGIIEAKSGNVVNNLKRKPYLFGKYSELHLIHASTV